MTDISSPPGKNPIASKDRAETFAESDVSVSFENSRASVSSGSLSLDFTDYALGTGTSGNNDNSTFDNEYFGISFIPQVDFDSVDLEWGVTFDYLDFQVVRADNSEVIYQEGSGTATGGELVTISPTDGFVSGVRYYAATEYISGNGGITNTGSDPAIPSNYAVVAETGPYRASGPVSDDGRRAMFSTIIPSVDGHLTESAFIEWPQPTDIYRWDAATFQTSPDGETVEVFVEESTDGGSTWTEIQGPIGRGEQIEADPGSRVRFRVELSRNDTANNPTLDAIYRRWVV